MGAIRWVKNLKNTLWRGVFPHELSFFLDLPWRRIVLSPQQLVDRLDLKPNNRVLEVGAGTGYYSPAVAREITSGRLELMDLQVEMLDKARRKLAVESVSNVGYTTANANSLPFVEETFDRLFLVAVLGEISDRNQFLSEARRVLKPSGILSISEHVPDPDFSSFPKVTSLVEKQGFKLLHRHGKAWSYTATFSKTLTL